MKGVVVGLILLFTLLHCTQGIVPAWLKRIRNVLEEEGIRYEWLENVNICARNEIPGETGCTTQAKLLQRLSKTFLKLPKKVQKRMMRLLAEIALNLVNRAEHDNLDEVVETILETVNDILDVDIETILESQEQNETSTEILDTLEVLSEKIGENAENGKPTEIKKSNIGISAKRIENTDSDKWIFSRETNSKLSVAIGNASARSENYLAFIKLPRRALRAKESIVSFTYRNDALFLRGDNSGTTSGSKKNKSRVNSVILSARVGNRTISNLKNPVILEFEKKYIKGDNSNPSCVFWKRGKGKGKWSTNGCSLVNKTATNVFCECDHLTNFAILFDVSQTAANPLELQVITWIGCGISLAGLIITIVTFTIFRKLRKSLPAKILIFLCVHLSLLLIFFLVGVERTSPRVSCQVISSLIQFFLLSSFCWMLVEACNLYRNIVIVYISGAQKKFLKYSIFFAEGVPAIIVVATGLARRDELGTQYFCVVNGNGFYFGILLPVALILLLNIICLVLVMYRLTCKKDKLNRNTQGETSNFGAQARIAFTCSMTMGVTWVFGVLAISDATTAFQWLFAIFNSLQGFFIFFFRTLRNDDVIRQWRICFSRQDDKPKNFTGSQPHSKGIIHSNATESSPASTPQPARSPIPLVRQDLNVSAPLPIGLFIQQFSHAVGGGHKRSPIAVTTSSKYNLTSWL